MTDIVAEIKGVSKFIEKAHVLYGIKLRSTMGLTEAFKKTIMTEFISCEEGT